MTHLYASTSFNVVSVVTGRLYREPTTTGSAA
jgi:hypothetical protein